MKNRFLISNPRQRCMMAWFSSSKKEFRLKCLGVKRQSARRLSVNCTTGRRCTRRTKAMRVSRHHRADAKNRAELGIYDSIRLDAGKHSSDVRRMRNPSRALSPA
jgi:hypothetical protein